MKQSKLYEVSVELTLCVLADNEQDAQSLGNEHAADECDNLTKSDFVANRMKYIPQNWQNACPYGNNYYDDRTVQEIFDAEKASDEDERKRIEFEKRQRKLFEDK